MMLEFASNPPLSAAVVHAPLLPLAIFSAAAALAKSYLYCFRKALEETSTL